MTSCLLSAVLSLRRFASCESGAVTVDWVVLTASIVGLAVGTAAIGWDGALNLATNVNAAMSGITIEQIGVAPPEPVGN